jgi:hypothetical protein
LSHRINQLHFAQNLQGALKISYNNLSNTSKNNSVFPSGTNSLWSIPHLSKSDYHHSDNTQLLYATLFSLGNDFVHHSMFYDPELH